MLEHPGASWNQSFEVRICGPGGPGRKGRRLALHCRDMTAKLPVSDSPAPSSTPDSPCVAVCSTLFDDICRGCGRTAMEVANWVQMSPEEKQAVWQRIRAQGYPRRKG